MGEPVSLVPSRNSAFRAGGLTLTAFPLPRDIPSRCSIAPVGQPWGQRHWETRGPVTALHWGGVSLSQEEQESGIRAWREVLENPTNYTG